jgi:alpha-galactosidase
VDEPVRLTLLPLESDGWSGTPALAGSRGGLITVPSFRLDGIDSTGEGSLRVRLVDAATGLAVTVELALGATGVLELRYTVTNTGSSDFALSSLVATLPVPARAREVLDFSGRWSFERRPQRRELDHGTWSRRIRHGRTGHDSPFLLAAGTTGFGFRGGELWALHLAWSGDQDVFAEYQATGLATIGAGELLQPGEVALAPGASYSTPLVLAAWSDSGLDGVSARLHAWVRARRVPPLPPRPVILNTWEAVYFDQDPVRLVALAELAAGVGVERFVLDDGWMTGRTGDDRSLGDWTVDPVRWPQGLHPLIRRVTELGMDFGLWVEPEMVSVDSELARNHPDWLLRGDASRLPRPWRHQFALDLDNPEAFANILAQLCALLDEYPIAYLKWDQNRDLLGGSAHRQTLATGRLMDELRRRYPALEIESCSSGGARIDLGILDRTDRVWVSDTNDPLERQPIQRWTSLLVPPELLGSHLGAARAHTTGRTTDLGFRLATALFLSAGIEWDLARATAEELEAVRRWIVLYKASRGLLHSGTVVRMDAVDPAIEVHGVVSTDRSEAMVALVCLGGARDAIPGPVRFSGLDPERSYRVEPVSGLPAPHLIQVQRPAWLIRGHAILTGRALEAVGLPAPALAPAQALVLRVSAV